MLNRPPFRSVVLMALLLALYASVSGQTRAQGQTSAAGHISMLRNGNGVQVQRQGAEEWLDVERDDPLYPGDTIRTGSGSAARIVLTPSPGDQDTLDVRPDTLLTLPGGAVPAGDRAAVALTRGIINIVARREAGTQGPEYCTATFCVGVLGTELTLQYNDASTHALLLVIDGEVEVTSGEGQPVVVSGGEMLEWDGTRLPKPVPLNRPLALSFETPYSYYDERPFPAGPLAAVGAVAAALLTGAVLYRRHRQRREV